MSIASLPQRLRRHGLLGSLKLVPKTVHFVARNALSPSARRRNAESSEFDRTYGTRTHGAIPLGALGATLEQSTQSRSYYQAVLPNRLHARRVKSRLISASSPLSISGPVWAGPC